VLTGSIATEKSHVWTIYGVPYSHQHIAHLEKAEKFPHRIQLGRCRVAWCCTVIEAWIASRGPAIDDCDRS
jgi:predicted DNA-binding transcriptional regulator AlpA